MKAKTFQRLFLLQAFKFYNIQTASYRFKLLNMRDYIYMSV